MADKVNEACLTKRELPESLLVFGEALTLLSLVGMSLFTLHAQMIPSFEISCDALYHVNLDGPNGRRPLFTNGKTIRRKLNVFRTVSGLWRRESYALASVVAALSGVWPHVKLLLCAVAVGLARRRGVGERWHLLTTAGRLAFVDVMMVGVLVSCGRFGLRYDDLVATSNPAANVTEELTPLKVSVDFEFQSRPCSGVFYYTAAICLSQILCHTILNAIVREGGGGGELCDDYGATAQVAEPVTASWARDEAAAAPADGPAWSDPEKDEPKGTPAPAPAPGVDSLAEHQLDCCVAEAEEWSVGLTVLFFSVLFGAAYLALATADAPGVVEVREEMAATLTVRDLNRGRAKVSGLPDWIGDVGVHLERVYDRSPSVWGLVDGMRRDGSGAAAPPRARELFRRVAFFAVTLPLVRVGVLLAAFLVPGRCLRYVVVHVLDVISMFTAADAFVVAVVVCAYDMPNLFMHLVHNSCPKFLKHAFHFDMHLHRTNALVVAAIVAFEELFARCVARPALARAHRRDWGDRPCTDEAARLVGSAHRA